MAEFDSIAPARVDFRPVKRGDSMPARPLAIFSRDGQPMEVVSAILQVRTKLLETLVTEWKTSDASILISGSSGNAITLAGKSAAQTAAFPVGTHDYELEVTFAAGTVITVFEGVFPVTLDKTHTS